MNLKLVIFDMDGSMFDIELLGSQCFEAIAKKFRYIIEKEL